MCWPLLLCIGGALGAAAVAAPPQAAVPSAKFSSGSSAPSSRWPWPDRGDVRAVISLSQDHDSSVQGGVVAARIQWRRRDANPEKKAVIVTDSEGLPLANVTVPLITQDHGVVVFTPRPAPANQTYFVYYLPYTQSGIGHATMAWAPPANANSSSYRSVAKVSGVKKAVHARQEFALPKPVTGRRFRWGTTQSWGGFQPFVCEVAFKTSAGWLANHATSARQAPLTGASSWQPNGGVGGSGHPWQALDGNDSTTWDPRAEVSWLDLDFGKEVTLEAVGITNYGDSTHDLKAYELSIAPPLGPPPSPSPPWQSLPAVPASAIRIESRDDFHNIIPMGLPANASELAGMVRAHPSPDGVWVFAESRDYKVMMEDRVPQRWVAAGPSTSFAAAGVRRGEWFYWQVALWTTQDLRSITLSNLTLAGGGVTLRAECLNTEGSTSLGEDVSPTHRPAHRGFTAFLVSAKAHTVRALWIGVHIPATVSPGTILRGVATLGLDSADGRHTSRLIGTALTIGGQPASPDQGFSDLESYTRLSWLNSKYAIDEEVVAPYTALVVHQHRQDFARTEGQDAEGSASAAAAGFEVELLNRRVVIGVNGLPHSVTVTRPASAHGFIAARPINLLAAPVSFELMEKGKALPVTVVTAAAVWRTTPSTVSWSAEVTVATGPALRLLVNGSIQLDGYIDFCVELAEANPIAEAGGPGAPFEVEDIRLQIEWAPQPKEGIYYMGMAQHGQAVAASTAAKWHWSTSAPNNFMWAGSASAGLRVELKDDNDPHRDAAIKSYSTLPLTWDNIGRGGVNITAVPLAAAAGGGGGGGVDLGLILTAYTGPYTLAPAVAPPAVNGSRTFRFDMSVTPFKPRDEAQHWKLRHFQVGYPGSAFTSAEDVHKTGATVINIHQGVDTMINPFINYPFIPESVALLANYTQTANKLGMRVKFYYTVRELSNHCAEIWAMRQLGDEIYSRPDCTTDSGGCGGAAWLQEQLGTSYAPVRADTFSFCGPFYTASPITLCRSIE
jgi:hypothetical protein